MYPVRLSRLYNLDALERIGDGSVEPEEDDKDEDDGPPSVLRGGLDQKASLRDAVVRGGLVVGGYMVYAIVGSSLVDCSFVRVVVWVVRHAWTRTRLWFFVLLFFLFLFLSIPTNPNDSSLMLEYSPLL